MSHGFGGEEAPTPSLPAVVRSLVLPIMVCGLAVPCLLGLYAGSVARLAYPAYAFLAGVTLFVSSPSAYPAFCVTLFAISPLIRRLVDYGAGFADFNPVLLAPYLALLPCLLPLLRQAMAQRPQALPFLLLLACVGYGTLLALSQARIVPAFYEALRWILPVALAAFIIESRAVIGHLRSSLAATLAIIVPLIAVYGVAQYFNPQAWDLVWLQNVIDSTASTSFGRPAPYEVRVFATMNSPGSLAMFLATAIPLMFGEGGLVALAGLAGLPVLALTVVRGGWIACLVGLLVTFVMARGTQKLAFLAAGGVLAILGVGLAGSLQLAPEVVNGISERLGTFGEIGSDRSAQERLSTYGIFFDRLSENPLGEGFGANAGLSAVAERRDLVPLDSGILEAFLTFGPVAGALYFIAFGSLVVLAYKASCELRGSLPGYFGSICALVAVLPLGSNQLGELGVLSWAAIGVLLASAEAKAIRAAAKARRAASRVPEGSLLEPTGLRE